LSKITLFDIDFDWEKVGTKKYVIVGKEKTQVPAIGVLIGETTLDPSKKATRSIAAIVSYYKSIELIDKTASDKQQVQELYKLAKDTKLSPVVEATKIQQHAQALPSRFKDVKTIPVKRMLTEINNATRFLHKKDKRLDTKITKPRAQTTQKEETKIETKRDFEQDQLIQDWINSKSTGIGNKAAKTRKSFASRLFKAMRIMGIETGQAFEAAGNQKDKVEWLAKKMEAVRKFSEEKIAWDPTANKGKGGMVEKPKSWITGGESTYYSFVMPVRSFASHLWGGLPKLKDKYHALAGHVRRHGRHADLRAEPEKIDAVVDCAKKVYDETGYMDPYMYVLLGLTCGMRKLEALTIPLERVTPKGKGFEIKMYNRKTQHALGISGNKIAEDSDAFYLVVTADKNLADLIRTRLEDKKYNQKQLLIGSTNEKDEDNYILPRYDTINNKKVMVESVMDVVKSTGIEHSIKEKTATVKKLGHTLRQCYIDAELVPKMKESENFYEVKEAKMIEGEKDEFGNPKYEIVTKEVGGKPLKKVLYKSGLDETNYFYKKPFHAVRHMMAQLWLDSTNWNYGLVARLGHWKTIKELEDSYGEKPDDIFIAEYADAADIVASKLKTQTVYDKSELKDEAQKMVKQDEKLQDAEELAEEVLGDKKIKDPNQIDDEDANKDTPEIEINELVEEKENA
jgi:hypothetical protein